MHSKRATFFIDGFNLYHSINTRRLKKYKWLDLRSLCEKFIVRNETIDAVYYFTAYTHWMPDKETKHRAYVAVNEDRGCRTIFGRFQEKQCISLVKCGQPCNPQNSRSRCGKTFVAHEEKLTDVNIAVRLLKACVAGECDAVYLLSGDNDLIPSLETAKEICPAVDIRIVIPIGARALNLINTCQKHGFKYIRINERHLTASLLPDSVTIDGSTYHRPPSWR